MNGIETLNKKMSELDFLRGEQPMVVMLIYQLGMTMNLQALSLIMILLIKETFLSSVVGKALNGLLICTLVLCPCNIHCCSHMGRMVLD